MKRKVFKYSEKHSPPAPIIKVGIKTLRHGIYETELLIDTGFSGGILLPFTLYEKLGLTLAEVQDRYYGILPIGVPITLHTAQAKIAINDTVEFETYIHSHPLINKKLAGRQLINKLKILLNGPRKKLELRI